MQGKPPVTDGPFAETKDLIAGFMIIDVDSYERAVELAGELSAAPGAGGRPIHEWLEVRPFMGSPDDRHRIVDAAAMGPVDEAQLRDLIPSVLAALVHRGADFATAEDAVQEALIRASRGMADQASRRPQGLADHHRVASLRRSTPDPTPRGTAAKFQVS